MVEDEALTFGEQLILAEEGQSEGETAPPRPQTELIVIERTDFTVAAEAGFNVKEPGRSFPIDGPGTLDSLVLVCDSETVDVYLAIDGQTVVDDDIETLIPRAGELNRISAYQRSAGTFVFAANDYEFQDVVEAAATPETETTFRLQRAEVDVVRGHP